MDDTPAFAHILNNYPGNVLLKKGGQKSAYKIDHPEYGVTVLKIGLYSNPQSLERIRREVRLLTEIDSIYYPKHYRFEVLDDNLFAIFEEYIDSLPLSRCMNRFTTPGSIFKLLHQLIDGLKILWAKDAVHRDLKPDNILIRPNGDPVIIDLGIARLLEEESLTQSGTGYGIGTRSYASPEQILNRKELISFRSDQFNLGIIVLELLLGGRHPFDPSEFGIGEDEVQNILNDQWPKSALDDPSCAPYKRLITKLLAPQPHGRYRTIQMLEQELNSILEAIR